MQEIRWEVGNYGTRRGYIGDVELFSISDSTKRDDCTVNLRTLLPGWKTDRSLADAEEAKRIAQLIVARFINLLVEGHTGPVAVGGV